MGNGNNYVIGKDFNTKDWFIYNDDTQHIECRCDTEEEAIEVVEKLRNGYTIPFDI